MLKFPWLEHQISSLPECWWYRHPKYRNLHSNEWLSPQYDADLLHSYNGQEPASESKEMVRRRIKWFFQWLCNGPQNRYNNIVVYSHCCTIFEMEKYLKGFDDNIEHPASLSMPQNTEIRSFELVESANYFENYDDKHLWSNFDGYYVPTALASTAAYV
eukprot:UN03361